ncbi:MAG: 1-acyl-sn-glycerol-3-phosphate acyltransferase [Burkholderiaceae bacterium]|jgi:1-acyl-sn-glycerol-3-phosphate acyltransferase|nr:1-acyl-sn-glycerol-3-phosphate acyltransferase [Burkholderiaceae bacterium]
MNLLRSALHMLWMALTVIPWATLAVALSPVVPRRFLYWFCAGWLRVAVGGGRWILGIRNRISGLENLPQAGGQQACVILVKHQSAWETLVLPTILPRPLVYVFKRELLRIPFFGWALGRLEMIHIDRGRRVEAFARVVQQGKRLAARGAWIVMFPEGTRIGRGEVGTYRSGGARLAIECGVPVIPVAVTAAKCWPPRAFVKTPGVVDICFGPPIASAGRTHDELTREVENWIETQMLQLDPDAYPTGKARRRADVTDT